MNKEEIEVFTRYIDPTIEQLQQENKELKKENEKLKLNHKQLSDIGKMAISNSRLIQENNQQKERIDKAIEYIEDNSHYYNADGEIKFTIEEETEETFCKDLLEILEGDSNERDN